MVLDNLTNSRTTTLQGIRAIAQRDFRFVEADVRACEPLFAEVQFDAVLHFAGLKSVSASVAAPREYRDVNVGGTRTLLRAMNRHGVKRLVFSSSASVYGDPDRNPIPEDAPLRPKSPYGETKCEVEGLLHEQVVSDQRWCAVALRYFNPVGAHPSSLIGEDPLGPPENLMPILGQLARDEKEVQIFGADHPTPDGTCIRDYVHVCDVARGHIAALSCAPGKHIFNLGSGLGLSVLELVEAYRQASGRPLPYRFAPRRPGDVSTSVADPSRAAKQLGWRAEADVQAMCRDAWAYQARRGSPSS